MATLASCSWGLRIGGPPQAGGPWPGRETGQFQCSVPGPDSQHYGF